MKKSQAQTVTVDIDLTLVATHVEESVQSALTLQVEAMLAEAVKEKVHALVDGITRREIEKAVKSCLDDGWQTTNSYGEPIGPKLGLKGRIAEILTKQEGDYNRRVTRVQKIAAEVIDAAFRAEFGKQIKEAQQQFKQQVDSVVAAKFTETIKAALGLR